MKILSILLGVWLSTSIFGAEQNLYLFVVKEGDKEAAVVVGPNLSLALTSLRINDWREFKIFDSFKIVSSDKKEDTTQLFDLESNSKETRGVNYLISIEIFNKTQSLVISVTRSSWGEGISISQDGVLVNKGEEIKAFDATVQGEKARRFQYVGSIDNDFVQSLIVGLKNEDASKGVFSIYDSVLRWREQKSDPP